MPGQLGLGFSLYCLSHSIPRYTKHAQNPIWHDTFHQEPCKNTILLPVCMHQAYAPAAEPCIQSSASTPILQSVCIRRMHTQLSFASRALQAHHLADRMHQAYAHAAEPCIQSSASTPSCSQCASGVCTGSQALHQELCKHTILLSVCIRHTHTQPSLASSRALQEHHLAARMYASGVCTRS